MPMYSKCTSRSHTTWTFVQCRCTVIMDKHWCQPPSARAFNLDPVLVLSSGGYLDMRNCGMDVMLHSDVWVACAGCGAESLVAELKCGHRHESGCSSCGAPLALFLGAPRTVDLSGPGRPVWHGGAGIHHGHVIPRPFDGGWWRCRRIIASKGAKSCTPSVQDPLVRYQPAQSCVDQFRPNIDRAWMAAGDAHANARERTHTHARGHGNLTYAQTHGMWSGCPLDWSVRALFPWYPGPFNLKLLFSSILLTRHHFHP